MGLSSVAPVSAQPTSNIYYKTEPLFGCELGYASMLIASCICVWDVLKKDCGGGPAQKR